MGVSKETLDCFLVLLEELLSPDFAVAAMIFGLFVDEMLPL